jgi:hypothetical protein
MFHVAIDRLGDVYFDGKPTDLAKLPLQLEIVPKMGAPEPATILETEMGAPCAVLNQVRLIMNEQLKCDRGAHCDEGVQAVWRNFTLTWTCKIKGAKASSLIFATITAVLLIRM